MNFENIENKEKREDFNPEIRIGTYDDVRTSIYFEALESLVNNNWEYKQNQQITDKVKNLLEKQDLDNFLQKYKFFQEKVDNKELLSWLALAYERDSEFKEYIIQEIVQYKDFERKEAEEIMKEFDAIMAKILDLVNLDQIIEPFVADNIEERNEQLPELKEDLENALKFFKVKEGDIEIKEYIYLPTNPLYKKQSGNGMEVGKYWFVNAEMDNRVNQVHEFLHSFINPITENIKFSKGEQEKIKVLAPDWLLEQYPEAMSLLNEVLIRTYKTGLETENDPAFDVFKRKVLRKLPSELERFLVEERKRGFENFANNVADFQKEDVLKKYYERYEYNELTVRVWNFYQTYAAQDELTFLEYFQKNYKDLLK